MEMLLLIAVIAVLILQIITISIVSGNKKHKRGSYEFKHQRHGNDGKNDRKEGDFRRANNNGSNRKNQHENKGGRPQHPAAPAQQSSQVTIDPVEKSLRDINLKLKNAEREQESARKKINDYNGKDGRPQRPERSGGGNGANRKNNRDRNFNRGEQRRENWQEKSRADLAEQPSEAAPASPEFENEKLHTAAVQPAVETVVSVTEPVSQSAHTDTADSTEGDFEHGRKFVAKRRHLQDNGASETEAAANENAAEAAAAEQTAEETSAEMKFGRR